MSARSGVDGVDILCQGGTATPPAGVVPPDAVGFDVDGAVQRVQGVSISRCE